MHYECKSVIRGGVLENAEAQEHRQPVFQLLMNFLRQLYTHFRSK